MQGVSGLILVLGASCATAQTPSVYQPYRVRSVTGLLEELTKDAEFQKVKQITRDQFEIVFVPGILGSELRIGDKTFGQDTPDSKWLTLNEETPVQASTLNSFRVGIRIGIKPFTFARHDIYGSGLDLLSAALGRTPLEFAYDWRADLSATTTKFSDMMAAPQMRGKRVLIVAHSMGGLIVWNWLKQTEAERRDPEVVAAVFLGSPLAGSCEPIRTLISGHSAIDGTPVWEAVVTKLLFSSAYAATFTFPSLFAILPKEPCLSKRLPDGTLLSVDHFSEAFWIGRAGAQRALYTRTYAESGLSSDRYLELVRRAIRLGRDFRNNLDLSPPNVPVFTVYSNSREMNEKFVFDDDDDWYRLVGLRAMQKNGDGRVLADSAMNLNYLLEDPSAFAYEVDLDHGALLSDPKFGRFVRNTLSKAVNEKLHAKDILKLAPMGRPDFGNHLIQIQGEALTASAQQSSEQKRIAFINLSKIPSTGKEGPLQSALQTAAASAIQGDLMTAGTLYDSAYVANSWQLPPSITTEAAVVKLKQGDIERAFGYAAESLRNSAAFSFGYSSPSKIRLVDWDKLFPVFKAAESSENAYVRIRARRILNEQKREH